MNSNNKVSGAFVAGIALIIIGLILLSVPHSQERDENNKLKNSSSFLIIIGSIIVIVGLFLVVFYRVSPKKR